jgi:hypothetical protein
VTSPNAPKSIIGSKDDIAMALCREGGTIGKEIAWTNLPDEF